MSRTVVLILNFSVIAVLLSSCCSNKIPETKHIVPAVVKKQISVDEQKIMDLEKQLEAAAENEAELSGQIEKLKEEISEKEFTISVQGKIIGLLDDADQTLQKSIEEQVKKREPGG